jgi:hypothetical protein
MPLSGGCESEYVEHLEFDALDQGHRCAFVIGVTHRVVFRQLSWCTTVWSMPGRDSARANLACADSPRTPNLLPRTGVGICWRDSSRCLSRVGLHTDRDRLRLGRLQGRVWPSNHGDEPRLTGTPKRATDDAIAAAFEIERVIRGSHEEHPSPLHPGRRHHVPGKSGFSNSRLFKGSTPSWNQVAGFLEAMRQLRDSAGFAA